MNGYASRLLEHDFHDDLDLEGPVTAAEEEAAELWARGSVLADEAARRAVGLRIPYRYKRLTPPGVA